MVWVAGLTVVTVLIIVNAVCTVLTIFIALRINMADLWGWFSSVDADRSGNINSAELQRALAMGNLQFSLALCAQMIRMHDRDHSGTISFDEFQSLHQFLINTQNAFFHFDRDRSGNLSSDEVFQAFSYAGYKFDQPAFQAVLRTFDPDRNGQFSLAEYIAMSCFLQCAANTFRAFDSQGGGRITLDFNQFLYAAANCR